MRALWALLERWAVALSLLVSTGRRTSPLFVPANYTAVHIEIYGHPEKLQSPSMTRIVTSLLDWCERLTGTNRQWSTTATCTFTAGALK